MLVQVTARYRMQVSGYVMKWWEIYGSWLHGWQKLN